MNTNADYIFNRYYYWLKDLSNKNIIMHNDLDAIMSVCFLQVYSGLSKIAGIYDTKAFYMCSPRFLELTTDLKNCVAIDLDISIPTKKEYARFKPVAKWAVNFSERIK